MDINLPNVKREKRGNDLIIIVQGFYSTKIDAPKIKPSEISKLYDQLLGSYLGYAPITFASHQSETIINLINDPSMSSLQSWEMYFKKVLESNFLMGKATRFKADFLWLMNKENMAKVMLGKYQDTKNKGEGICRESITKAVINGVKSVNDVEYLTPEDKAWIIEKGGLLRLGRMSNATFKELFNS